MTIDYTGGIDPAIENMFTERPSDPGLRESVSFWTLDDKGRFALPRVGIEAVGERWDRHAIQVNVVLADGRIYRLRAEVPSNSPFDADGRPSILGAGPLQFRCLEPFRRSVMSFDGTAVETTSAAMVAGEDDNGKPVDVEFMVDARMTAPPWTSAPADSGELECPRYEQSFLAEGFLRIGGETFDFTGRGLRIRRQSVRTLVHFRGHCWQSALFPSGRSFGCRVWLPTSEGKEAYNDGYVFDGDGKLLPAKVVSAPWLRKIGEVSDDVSVVLSTPRGEITIAGETLFASYDLKLGGKAKDDDPLLKEAPDFPALQQAGVRYVWDGEETFGMIERSSPHSMIERA